MNLHEITAKLVARGCPEHPRLKHPSKHALNGGAGWWYVDQEGTWSLQHPDDALAIWTQWALLWAVNADAWPTRDFDCSFPTIEAIEAATRHLEAKE